VEGTSEVTLSVNIVGVDDVVRGFNEMGSSSAAFSAKVVEHQREISRASNNASREIKYFGREMAVFGSSIHAVGLLGEQFGLLNKEQAKVLTTMGSMVALSGTVVRALGYLADTSKLLALAEHARGIAHGFADFMAAGITKIYGAIVGAFSAIASSSIGVAIAEHARAAAHAVAHAFEGPWGWAILAAAAGIAAGVVATISGLLKFAEGGLVMGPTVALIGERGPEAVIPLSRIMNWNTTTSAATVYVTVNEAATPRATGDAVIDALRRSGVI